MMPCPMLGGKILMPSLMRFVKLPVEPTMLPFRYGALMPDLLHITQILVLFTVSLIQVLLLLAVFCIQVLMFSPVLLLSVVGKA
jgi:hypothetical protein